MWWLSLLCRLTRNRFRHLLHYCSGPSLCAALLSPSPDLIKWALARLKAIWTGYKGLQNLVVAGAVEALRKCWMNQPLCQVLFLALEAVNWQDVPDLVVQYLSGHFSLGSTKAIDF